jgi:hypothetical protein
LLGTVAADTARFKQALDLMSDMPSTEQIAPLDDLKPQSAASAETHGEKKG